MDMTAFGGGAEFLRDPTSLGNSSKELCFVPDIGTTQHVRTGSGGSLRRRAIFSGSRVTDRPDRRVGTCEDEIGSGESTLGEVASPASELPKSR